MKKLTLRSGLMATTTLLSSLAVTALVAGVATMPTTALAQSSVGSVYGKTTAGSVVSLTDTDTGVTQTAKASGAGDFVFSALPPGMYVVKDASGTSQTIEVKAGLGVAVSFDAPVIVVKGTHKVNAIDVKSVESTSIFTAAQIDSLPVSRELSSVALLAPSTAINGNQATFGNLVSIGGSSVAENGYYINGFDVTNIYKFVSYAELPFDAVAQEEVKVGGYGAEYGRSLGGVMSLVTKRGTNVWHYGSTIEYAPQALRTKSRDIKSIDPDDISNGDIYSVFQSANTQDSLVYNVYASGPLIEDKLYLFALVQGKDDQWDSYGYETSYHHTNSSPSGLIKLDWYITPNHHLEYTGIFNKERDVYNNYSTSPNSSMGEVKYANFHGDPTSPTIYQNGGEIDILKYTGRLTDNFTVSVMGGYLKSLDNDVNASAQDSCPRAYDSRANLGSVVYIGCYDENNPFSQDLTFQPNTDERKALRVDFNWVLGKHTIRFGYDGEEFSSSHRGQTYSGGAYWRYYTVYEADGRTVNGTTLPTGTNYVRLWDYHTGSGLFKVDDTALYLEDSWQITQKLMLYAGLRDESFVNKNGDGVPFIDKKNSIAPRFGFSWNVNGDSTLKIYGNAGRYYIPVSSNTNIRSSGTEYTEVSYYYDDGPDLATGKPIGLGGQIGATQLNGTKSPPDPASVTQVDLSPMYQDEFILGAQKKFNQMLTLGASATYRTVKSGMDDYCTHDAFQKWADDNGYGATFDYTEMPSCMIINPGSDVTLAFDADGSGTLTTHTVAASYFGLPKYKREYMAVSVFGELKGKNWDLNGSYTLSSSRGNAEGYVNTTLGQDDAGATQDFDNSLFEDGASGYLPNDHRHSIKLFGTYRLNDEWNFGGNLSILSGSPISCQGFIPLDDPSLQSRIGVDKGQLSLYSGSSFYCLNSDGTTTLKNRGSEGRQDWFYNFDGSASYTPSWGNGHVILQATIYNLLNLQTVTGVNMSTAKGSATSYQYNPNFLQPISYQSPRSVRLTLRYRY